MLKWISALLMLLDHFAIVFIPTNTVLYLLCRLIGRLSMPLFAYFIAVGFVHTKNLQKYIWRLLAMTAAAQIPFTWLYFGDNCFTFLQQTNWACLFYHGNTGLIFVCALVILRYE